MTINKAIENLRYYSDLIDQEKARGGMFFNGCKERSELLKRDLQELGIDARLLYVTSSTGFLTPENGAFWTNHYCVIDYPSSTVYDPSYTKKKPVDIREYPELYFEKDSLLFHIEQSNGSFARYLTN